MACVRVLTSPLRLPVSVTVFLSILRCRRLQVRSIGRVASASVAGIVMKIPVIGHTPRQA